MVSMAASKTNELPSGVVIDQRGKGHRKKKVKPIFKLRVQFCQRCPDVSEIRKLHPNIKGVFVPKRPSKVRYCILKCSTAKALEEVRVALHGKHIEPYQGILKCSETSSQALSKNESLNSVDLKKIRLTRAEVKQAKIVSSQGINATVDVKCNSTERELFVRYGINCSDLNRNKTQGF